MQHHDIHLTHKFLHEKEINEIYISIFLVALAESMIGIFIPIYFFKIGMPMTSIMLYYILMSAYFVFFSFIGAKITSRVGAKHSMLLSAPFLIIYYLGLSFVKPHNIFFFILPLFASIRMILYNYGFHINYIEHSNRKNRGKELSHIGILSVIATVFAPLISGLLITKFGFNTLFMTSSILLLGAAIPLLLSKDIYERRNIKLREIIGYTFSKKNIGNILSFTGYSVETRIGMILWPILIFTILTTPQKVGLITTMSMLISVITFYIIGKFVDRYDRNKMLNISTVLYFFSWISRLFATTPLRVLLADSYRSISEKILHIPWSVKSYDLTSKKNHFIFIVSREIVFNLSRMLIMPFILFVFYINYHPFVLAFLIASLFSLLYPFLRKN